MTGGLWEHMHIGPGKLKWADELHDRFGASVAPVGIPTMEGGAPFVKTRRAWQAHRCA
jgi:hypothetical protein